MPTGQPPRPKIAVSKRSIALSLIDEYQEIVGTGLLIANVLFWGWIFRFDSIGAHHSSLALALAFLVTALVVLEIWLIRRCLGDRNQSFSVRSRFARFTLGSVVVLALLAGGLAWKEHLDGEQAARNQQESAAERRQMKRQFEAPEMRHGMELMRKMQERRASSGPATQQEGKTD